jgi:lipopolysaccharide biosynthesis protein
MAALGRDPVGQTAAGLRAIVHALPGAVREPISAVARRAVAPRRPLVRGALAAPASDAAAAVPFGPAFPRPSLARPVGVVAHLFYPELASEMRAYLQRVPGPVDLHLSTDTEAKGAQLRTVFAGWEKGQLEVRLAPNRGRDVAPKLITFADAHARHDIVLHLHSKKSPHDSDLKMWRDFLYETLMGDGDVASSVLAAFEQRPDLGLAAPQHYFAVRNGVGWHGNLAAAERLAAGMGVTLAADGPLDFPTGSMFWARSAALKPLLDLGLAADDFEAEAGQADGTLAHAIERLYFHACEKAGYRWIKIARPELAPAAAGAPTPIASPEALARLMESVPPLGAAGPR